MNPHITLTLTMHYVYILQSSNNKSIYIGCASNLKKRLLMHNQNESYHTKKYSPWKPIYFDGFLSEKDVYSRGKSLKLHKQ